MASKGNTDLAGILLIGDIGKVFSDTYAIEQSACEVCVDLLDGIEASAKGEYRTIGVVMEGYGGKVASAIKSLREADAGAKIILLAQMYEESRARELVGSKSGDANFADDYLICPLRISAFLAGLSRLEERIPVIPDSSGAREGKRDSVLELEDRGKKSEERERILERLATEDELTGLKNRRYIFEFSRQILERAKREDSWATILIFDIDNFKYYNDVYGHSAGDEILKQAAVLMRKCCRSHDIVGRIGGDEFAVIFWDAKTGESSAANSERRSTQTEHPKEAVFIAKRFRREFNNSELDLLGPEGKGVLTISGGLAGFPHDGSTVKDSGRIGFISSASRITIFLISSKISIIPYIHPEFS